MNRTTLLKRIAKRSATLGRLKSEEVRETWLMGEDATAAVATYPQTSEGRKAAKAAIATAAKRDEGMIENLLRAVKVRDTELTKAQRAKVVSLGWSYDAVLVLSGQGSKDAPYTTAQKTRVIAKAEKTGTRNVVKVRGFKRDVVGGTKRNRRTSTDEKVALAKSIGEKVARLIADGDTYMALIHGAQLAQDNEGKDVAGALTLIATQATKAAKVVK